MRILLGVLVQVPAGVPIKAELKTSEPSDSETLNLKP